MRKLLLFLLITSTLCAINTSSETISANTEFARVENSTPIYKTTTGSNDIDNIFCMAEKTYYVKIIGNYQDYFRVIYNTINGYVKKNDVKEVSNTPSTPYPNNIKLIIGSNCNFRSTPTTQSINSNIITTLYSNEDNFQFVGRINSEEAIDFGGTTWYYVCYNGNYGYIYNKYVKSITPIYENNESFEYLHAQQAPIVNPITHTPSIIIIMILLIPCILIVTILYFPQKSNSKKPHTPKKTKSVDRY